MPRSSGKLVLIAITAFVIVPLVLAHSALPKVSEKANDFGHVLKPVSHDSFQQWAFAKLFPFNARWNSVLATFYISSFPNFILALVPTELDPTQLNTMIAFATGGLLGDVCMHLIPHSFMGEAVETGLFVDGVAIKHVVVEQKRNIIIGAAIFGGFFAFYFLDKTMRVLNASDESGSAGHSHSHHHHHHHAPIEAISSALDNKSISSEGMRQRKDKSEGVGSVVEENKGKEVSASLRLSAYLNLFGDFTHNITDGLAMAASFYASPQLGAISTFATFCHEIPHEIADYSILIKSGFTKRQAMTSQFITAIGAFVGTFLGIWIAESAGAGTAPTVDKIGHGAAGFFGTSVRGADIVIPATAGGFLYIASVSVIPELLAESRSVKQTLKEYGFMMFGFGVMGLLAWNE